MTKEEQYEFLHKWGSIEFSCAEFQLAFSTLSRSGNLAPGILGITTEGWGGVQKVTTRSIEYLELGRQEREDKSTAGAYAYLLEGVSATSLTNLPGISPMSEGHLVVLLSARVAPAQR